MPRKSVRSTLSETQPMELLKKIALGEKMGLTQEQEACFALLIEKRLVRKMEATRKLIMSKSYDELQERHALLLDAKGCLERIAKRNAPKKGLVGMLSFKNLMAADLSEDKKLFELLLRLDLRIREVEDHRELVGRLDKIRERLVMEDRECLDRMAQIDREQQNSQEQVQDGTPVEPVGCIALTEEGMRKLPEFNVMEDLEVVFNSVCGPRKHKIDDFAHFREDPSSLLIFMMDNPFGEAGLTRRAMEYEGVIEAYEKVAPYLEMRSFRARNAFLMRLCLASRGDMRKAYQFCNRERLQSLLEHGRRMMGEHLYSGEQLPVLSLDLSLHELLCGDDSTSGGRIPSKILFPQIIQGFAQSARERGMEDRATLRLALALHAWWQGQSGGIPAAIGAEIQAQIATIREYRNSAPVDLGQEASRWIFGYHLAHLAGFEKEHLSGILLRYKAVDAAFQDESRSRLAPVQVVLHALASLYRMECAGLWVDPKRYAATYRRILRFMHNDRNLDRMLQAVPEEDALYLAAYLTARTYFLDPDLGRAPQRMADVGMAGIYECKDHNKAPLLGGALGTLMIR